MFANEAELDDFLSKPSPALIETMKRLTGDIMILGIAGKMGLTMGRRAVNAVKAAKVDKKVYGVARFSDQSVKPKLIEWDIEPIACDLMDREAVGELPQVANVIFMAGRKFGTDGQEDLTWAVNTLVPQNVIEHFKASNIVAFSTGCVYPLVTVESGGCDESVCPAPVGEYSQSCLGRERIFQYAARRYGVKVLLYRLNYAIDMRYGVLHDIAKQILHGERIDDSVQHFNVIWQGDANDIALRALEHCTTPASILNVTGPETVSLNHVAAELGCLLGKEAIFAGHPSSVAYLNNAQKCFELFGYPSYTLRQMIKAQAMWLLNGGASHGKPTHFEVNTGKF